MNLESPISVEDFLRAVGPTFELEENARRKRAKPRASGIANCARQQWYYMNDVEPTNPRALDMDLTAEQGRMFEDIVVRVFEEIDLTVTGRQTKLPEDYPVTGHPDGELEWLTTEDGLRFWGFEHKHYGRYEYERMLKLGLEQGNPEALCQILMYGDALGWDAALLVVVAQDASAVRGDMTVNKRSKEERNVWVTPDMNPKVAFYTVDVAEYAHTLTQLLKMRAAWLTAHRDDPLPPAPEFVPFPTGKQDKVEFPCSHCLYMPDCREAGPGGLMAPRLPFIEEVKW